MTLSSCVLAWDIDQWPGPVQEYSGHHTGWHDVRLVPDLATLRPAAWLDRTAIVVADFVELGREDLVAVAPRTILRRQIERTLAAGLTPQVATELEFALYRGTYDEGRSNGYETLPPTTLARRLHDPSGGPIRGILRRRARGARGLRARSVDEPGRVGTRPVGDQPRVPRRARDGGPARPVQTRDARPGRGRRDVGHVHGATVLRHDRIVLPPASVNGRRVRFERVPRSRSRARRLRHPPTCGRRGARPRARPDAAVRPDGELVPTDPERRVLGQRAVVGRRQPDGLGPRLARRRGDEARVACARRRRERVPRDRGAPRLGRRGHRIGGRSGRAADGLGFDEQVSPLPSTLGEAVAASGDGAFAAEVFGKDVVSHYAEAGHWEWERFLAPEAVTEWERRRYFEVI